MNYKITRKTALTSITALRNFNENENGETCYDTWCDRLGFEYNAHYLYVGEWDMIWISCKCGKKAVFKIINIKGEEVFYCGNCFIKTCTAVAVKHDKKLNNLFEI